MGGESRDLGIEAAGLEPGFDTSGIGKDHRFEPAFPRGAIERMAAGALGVTIGGESGEPSLEVGPVAGGESGAAAVALPVDFAVAPSGEFEAAKSPGDLGSGGQSDGVDGASGGGHRGGEAAYAQVEFAHLFEQGFGAAARSEPGFEIAGIGGVEPARLRLIFVPFVQFDGNAGGERGETMGDQAG